VPRSSGPVAQGFLLTELDGSTIKSILESAYI
jgi:hypothetical protein